MNTTIFILKISLMLEDGSYDYVKVAGAFFNREDAWKKANEKIERMKLEWNNWKVIKKNADEYMLKSETGLVKWYQVIEMSVK